MRTGSTRTTTCSLPTTTLRRSPRSHRRYPLPPLPSRHRSSHRLHERLRRRHQRTSRRARRRQSRVGQVLRHLSPRGSLRSTLRRSDPTWARRLAALRQPRSRSTRPSRPSAVPPSPSPSRRSAMLPRQQAPTQRPHRRPHSRRIRRPRLPPSLPPSRSRRPYPVHRLSRRRRRSQRRQNRVRRRR